MSTLETNSIGKYSGNNVSIDDALNLKSYTTTQMNALTASAGDMIYNSTTGSPHFFNGSTWEEAWNKFTLVVDYLVLQVVQVQQVTGSLINGGGGGGAGGLRSGVGNTGGGGSLESH